MASLYDSPDLSAARNDANAAVANASSLAGEATSLPDILHQTLVQKFTNSNPLYAERENAAKNFLTTYTQAPLDYTAKSAGGNSDVIYNPLQLQNLIQGRRAGALAPLTTANDKLSLATGGLDNIINSAKNVFSGIVTKAQGDATAKRQSYQDLLTETSKRVEEDYQNKSLAQQRELALLKSSAANKKVPVTLQKSVSDFNTVQSTMNQLVDQAKLIKNKLGKSGPMGKLQSTLSTGTAMIGNDPDFKQFINLVDGLASIAAKGIGKETGVLTNQDIGRIKSALPSQYDTQEELDLKLKTLRDIQKNSKLNVQQQFKLNGIPYDESYLSPGGMEASATDYTAILDALNL